MRILHIVYNCIPGKYRGGVPKICFELAKAQATLGHTVSIYTTDYNGNEKEIVVYDQDIVTEGIRLRYFPAKLRPCLHSPGMQSFLRQDDVVFDVVHGHSIFLPFNRYAAGYAKCRQKPLFLHPQGALDPLVLRRGILKRVKKWVYITLIEKSLMNHATAVIAVTPHEKRQIEMLNVRSPIEILPNGIESLPPADPARVQAFRARLGLPETAAVLGYLGRFVPKKGVHLLIEAFGALRKLHPHVCLLLAGDRTEDPVYTATLDRIIRNLGGRSGVCWAGFLSDREKPDFFATCRAISHVSESEGMALAVLEAMAAGLPVLVSSGCYMDEAVRAGAVVECSYEVQSVLFGLRRMIEDEEYRRLVSKRATEHVAAHHSWRTVAERLDRVYGKAYGATRSFDGDVAEHLDGKQ